MKSAVRKVSTNSARNNAARRVNIRKAQVSRIGIRGEIHRTAWTSG